MLARLLGAVAGVSCGASAIAQTVEFRFVERTGQQVVMSSDTLLEISLQARVVGGLSLGGFSLTIAILGEPVTSGTLQLARISGGSCDPTYFSGAPWPANAAAGLGGMAGQFSYLAGQAYFFNGLINTSGGTFTHNPSQQEIGLIEGLVMDRPLLCTPGIDSDGDLIPDLAASNGGTSWEGETCPLNATAAGPYFATGQFIDVYRFRYIASSLVPRMLSISLRDRSAPVFGHLVVQANRWSSANSAVLADHISVAPLMIQVGSGSGVQGACCASNGACTSVNQIVCPAGSVWTQSQACSLSICPRRGACCDHSGGCVFVFSSVCAASNNWTADLACVPNSCAQPGQCCTSDGLCSMVLVNSCFGFWAPTRSCSSNSCPGACCNGTFCTLTDETTCRMFIVGSFRGTGIACGVAGNPTGCCPANFDGQNGVGVADVFVFLNAWLAGDVAADFDRNNDLSVFDIYGFLYAWFQGCS